MVLKVALCARSCVENVTSPATVALRRPKNDSTAALSWQVSLGAHTRSQAGSREYPVEADRGSMFDLRCVCKNRIRFLFIL
jgi:hypothetical protein